MEGLEKIDKMQVKKNVYVGLVHWPVLSKSGNIVTTNVTNFDIHDIARSCRTYGVHRYFIINKMKEQLMFVSRVLEHWRTGEGAYLNPRRKTALTMIALSEDLSGSIKEITDIEGKPPWVLATAARSLTSLPIHDFKEIRQWIFTENEPDCCKGVESEKGVIKSVEKNEEGQVRSDIESESREKGKDSLFLVFGTGFGLASEALSLCQGLLPPLRGASEDDYRHLSVRSAVSICLDRLLGL